jgi:hypothetical protein
VSTFEYVDAAGKAHTLVASSPTKAAQAVARVELDRTGSVALAYRAAGTVEAKASA